MSFKEKLNYWLDVVVNSDGFGWFVFGWMCFFMPLVSVWAFWNDHYIIGVLALLVGLFGWAGALFKKYLLVWITKLTLKFTMKNAGVDWKLKDLGWDDFNKKR